jgi:hypothetical protein
VEAINECCNPALSASELAVRESVLRALAASDVFGVTTHQHLRHTARSGASARIIRTACAMGRGSGPGQGSWKAWGMLEVALEGEVPYEAAWDSKADTPHSSMIAS